jgi:hypothetical protein
MTLVSNAQTSIEPPSGHLLSPALSSASGGGEGARRAGEEERTGWKCPMAKNDHFCRSGSLFSRPGGHFWQKTGVFGLGGPPPFRRGNTPRRAWNTPDDGRNTPPTPWKTPRAGGKTPAGGVDTPRRPWSIPERAGNIPLRAGHHPAPWKEDPAAFMGHPAGRREHPGASMGHPARKMDGAFVLVGSSRGDDRAVERRHLRCERCAGNSLSSAQWRRGPGRGGASRNQSRIRIFPEAPLPHPLLARASRREGVNFIRGGVP